MAFDAPVDMLPPLLVRILFCGSAMRNQAAALERNKESRKSVPVLVVHRPVMSLQAWADVVMNRLEKSWKNLA
jgi:hypothetical protein